MQSYIILERTNTCSDTGQSFTVKLLPTRHAVVPRHQEMPLLVSQTRTRMLIIFVEAVAEVYFTSSNAIGRKIVYRAHLAFPKYSTQIAQNRIKQLCKKHLHYNVHLQIYFQFENDLFNNQSIGFHPKQLQRNLFHDIAKPFK